MPRPAPTTCPCRCRAFAEHVYNWRVGGKSLGHDEGEDAQHVLVQHAGQGMKDTSHRDSAVKPGAVSDDAILSVHAEHRGDAGAGLGEHTLRLCL